MHNQRDHFSIHKRAYLQSAITSLFKDTFSYLEDLDDKLLSIFSLVLGSLEKSTDPNEVARLIRNLVEIGRRDADSLGMFYLGEGRVDLSRWDDPMLEADPDFFKGQKKADAKLYEKYDRGLVEGYICAREVRKKIKMLEAPVYQTDRLRGMHTYIVGKSGYGKTTVLVNMAVQDLNNDVGFAVVAPDNDVFRDLAPHIPEHRLKDVIYINPFDQDNSVSLNPLYLHPGENIENKARQVTDSLKWVLGFKQGVTRMGELFRNCVRSLLEIPGTSIVDVKRLLDRENPHFRNQVIAQLSNKHLQDFSRIDYLSTQYPKGTSEGPINQRLNPLIQDPLMEKVLCSTENVFNMREAMDEGKIVFINLSDGLIGKDNASLLGALMIVNFRVAASSRANIKGAHNRRRFVLYVDEFQEFTSSSEEAIGFILSRARKYGLPLVIAHQYMKQIPDRVLNAIQGNCSTYLSFKVSAPDQKRLRAEGMMVGEQEKQNLEVGEGYCVVGDSSSFLKTPPPVSGGNKDNIDRISVYSADTNNAKGSDNDEDDEGNWDDPSKVF